MSGTLSAALPVAAAFVAAFTGNGVMVLGDLVLSDFALPERVSYGGAQAMTVHRLPGGARVIDTMGPDEAEISWSGIFLGIAAELQAATLDAIRQVGQPVLLAWGVHVVQVVVRDVTFDGEFNRINYRVSCTVLPDVAEQDLGGEAEGAADGSTGDGEPPATPDAAAQRGTASLSRAHAARALPVPPIPPSTVPGPGHA